MKKIDSLVKKVTLFSKSLIFTNFFPSTTKITLIMVHQIIHNQIINVLINMLCETLQNINYSSYEILQLYALEGTQLLNLFS